MTIKIRLPWPDQALSPNWSKPWYNILGLVEQNTRALCFPEAATISQSDIVGIAPSTFRTNVLAVRLSLGSKRGGRFAMARPWTEEEDEFLRDNYYSMTRKEIGDCLGRSAPSVRARCYRLGMNTKKEPEWTEIDTERLKAYYESHGEFQVDLDELAEFFGRTRWGVAIKASRLGLTNIRRKDFGGGSCRQRKFKTDDLLRWNISQRTKEYIRINGFPEGLQEYNRSGGHSMGFTGNRHTEQTKRLIGRKSKMWHDSLSDKEKKAIVEKALETRLKEYGTLSPQVNVTNPYSHARGGIREDLGFYVRSRWEANYARYLKFLKEQGEIRDWEYEPKSFVFDGIKRGAREYIPDFEITENDGSIVYHEVKGWMDKKSKTKLNRMAKYYPDVEVVVIGRDEYIAISKYSRLIPNWEDDRY